MDIITDKTFKYSLKGLDFKEEEFKFIKDFVYLTVDPFVSFETKYLIKDFRIHRVIENNPTKTEYVKNNNLMLFHGTNKTGAAGVLKTGFKNSESGYFGKGVYMTECSDTAFDYTGIPADCVKGTKFFNYIFVNEVLESEKLQAYSFNASDALDMDEDNTAELMHPFEKHFKCSSPQPTKEDYKEDVLGRKYRNVKISGLSLLDEYVADEKITVPRYLIALETERKEEEENLFSKIISNY